MPRKDSFKVGDWLVEPELDRISSKTRKKNLRPQVMELLVFLAQRPGRVVSTDDLLSELWDGRVVTEGSVYNCVSELRNALAGDGDGDGDSMSPIETIPKKGYRLVAPVQVEQANANSSDSAAGKHRSRIRISVFLLLGFALAGYAYWITMQRLGAPDSPTEIRSLAVLPFDNFSSQPGRDEYFTDGMTEALIARLGQIEGLRVISRTSAMKFKDSDMTIPEIAATLQVDGVIEGSVMTAAQEVRVTLQLIDGETDYHLWSNSYVRDLDDVITLQDEMANSIIRELRTLLRGPNSNPIFKTTSARQPATSNPDAYRAYLKGRYHFNRFGEDNFRAALHYYEQAIELDPMFALAYASLSEACMQPLVIFNRIRTLDDCERDAIRAATIDENLAEAFAALGFVRMFNWQWQQAKLDLERAIELDPNSVMARQWHAEVLRSTYRFDEALAEIRRAEELDPLNLFVKTMVGWPLFNLARYEEVLAQLDDVNDMDPDHMLAHYNRGLAYIQLRNVKQVFAAARRVAEIGGDSSFETRLLQASGHAIAGDSKKARDIIAGVERDGGVFMAAWIASIYLMMGEVDEALARLEQGVEDRSVDMGTISEPKFDAIRQHPRFRSVSRKMGLPDLR